jgi:septal ring factor EnvC (AmiA/AmiB activator)
MTCEQHQTQCDKRFAKLEGELLALTEEHFKLDGDVRVSNARVEQLTKSLAALTKALWGVVVSMLATLTGFLIWYIQTR